MKWLIEKFIVEYGEDHLTWKVGIKRNLIMLTFRMLSLGKCRKYFFSVEICVFSFYC